MDTRVELELREVSHRFGLRAVFENVCGTACGAQTLVVAGANGSGKSTLLRIAAGLLAPSSGRALFRWNGQELDAVARREHLGYVAPDLMLYRELSAAENLLFFASLRGISPSREELISMLAEVGLKGRGRDLVGAYSSGMRQRLKYAFALLARPPVLILDEPTANLDDAGVEIVRRIIDDQRVKGGITLIATNEARETAWGDTCIRLGSQ
jgi:heme exporter protein A